MNKLIALGNEARAGMMRGRALVQGAVVPTLGPRGRNAKIGKQYGPPKTTNDGVTIAKEVPLAGLDPFEKEGVKDIQEDVDRMNQEAGDGSSTFLTLTRALDREGMRHLSRGMNVMALKAGMERASRDVIQELKAMAVQVDAEDIEQVATISAESVEMGKIIADTIQKVGKDGVITVEESFTLGISAEIVEGMQIDRGYISPIMTTVPETMEAEYTDVHILVTDKKFLLLPEIKPFLDVCMEQNIKNLVVICTDMDGEALKSLLFNKIRGVFNILAVRAPGYGEEKLEILQDIAVTVGAQVVSDSTGISLEGAIPGAILGKAHRVTAGKDKTIIVGGAGDKKLIEARVAHLQKQIEAVEVKLSREHLQERLGKLTGGAAIVRVGAAIEGDMTYLVDKLDDAINATKAAIAEGIVPGGGVALVHIANKLIEEEFSVISGWYPLQLSAERTGYLIVMKALSEPLKQILSNAGTNPAAILKWIKDRNEDVESGYNAVNGTLEFNMFRAGIIDPVKVTRTAIQYAVASSAMALTTEVVIGAEASTS